MSKIEIHDHFAEQAHCVQCVGPCRLEGAELVATQLVRYIFEQWATAQLNPGMMLAYTIDRASVDIDKFKARAVETVGTLARVT